MSTRTVQLMCALTTTPILEVEQRNHDVDVSDQVNKIPPYESNSECAINGIVLGLGVLSKVTKLGVQSPAMIGRRHIFANAHPIPKNKTRDRKVRFRIRNFSSISSLVVTYRFLYNNALLAVGSYLYLRPHGTSTRKNAVNHTPTF
jgi:hypothetical protein